MSFKFQSKLQSFINNPLLTFILLGVAFTLSCSAAVPQQSEEQALRNLRQMMKDGKLPPETVVMQIESQFTNTRTGALAKLLRAQIHLSNNDGNGAADILNSNIFRQKTNVADYALWLRGKSLMMAARFAEAQTAFDQLVKEFPTSLRLRESKLLWADAALQSGQSQNIPNFLNDLVVKNDADALLRVAKAYEIQGNQPQTINFYRKVYFYGAGKDAGKEAETKLTALTQNLLPQNAEEAQARADKLFEAKNYTEAQKAYELLISFPTALTPQVNLRRLITAANVRNTFAAQSAFNLIPPAANEKVEAYNQLSRAFANSGQWDLARTTLEEMRQKFPTSPLPAKAAVGVGMIARDKKDKINETSFLRYALLNFPNAVDVAQAQFELAWLEHDSKNFVNSSQLLTEHLARYVDKDTTNRGIAGYWAARDSERTGKFAEACALYDAVNYRYGANWYGYLATQRIANLKATNKCDGMQNFPKDSLIGKAVANMKTVTVARESSTAKEQENFTKAEQLSAVGLYDWAMDELNEATRTASNSPKVNLAMAKLYRLRDDNTSAFLALKKSYPDYAQMFPEEMSREEWDIFYPLNYWDQIKLWGQHRNLDPYQVAGLIRQESVFYPRAKSGANAYGLMQLLIPTARILAKKDGAEIAVTGESLFQPALNIQLGTAYMREQFDKFGRIEFVAVAYNAGPGRVPQWQASLPYEMDEFVEAIPFKETKGYVQGVIRNSAQYRRLYDENGKFKSNVGTHPLRGEIDSKSPEQLAQEFPEIVLDKSGE